MEFKDWQLNIQFVVIKKTKFRDVNRFLKKETGDINMRITGSGVCDRMKHY